MSVASSGPSAVTCSGTVGTCSHEASLVKRTRESETEDDAEWLRQSNFQQDSEGLAESEASSDEDDKAQKPKLGAGLWGRGPPLVSRMLGKRMEFTDGFGLCSPGRWPPSKRRCAADTSSLGFAKSLGKELRKLLAQKLDARALAFKLATGTLHNCPFSDELIQDGRELLFTALEMIWLDASYQSERRQRTSRSFLLRLKNCCGFLGTRTAEHFTLANIPLPRVSKLAINQNCRMYLLFSTVRTDGESMRWVILSLGSAARIICLRDNTPSMCIGNSWKKRNWEP